MSEASIIPNYLRRFSFAKLCEFVEFMGDSNPCTHLKKIFWDLSLQQPDEIVQRYPLEELYGFTLVHYAHKVPVVMCSPDLGDTNLAPQ